MCLHIPAIFNWLAKRVSYPAAVKAGKFEIQRGMSLVNILKMFRNGRQFPVNLVITKLRTREDLASNDWTENLNVIPLHLCVS